MRKKNPIVNTYEKDTVLYSLATKTTGKKIPVYKIPYGMGSIQEPIEDDIDFEETESETFEDIHLSDEIARDIQYYAETGEIKSEYVEDHLMYNDFGFEPEISKFLDNY